MKFHQVMILLALVTLAMVAVGAMAQCERCDSSAIECDHCCMKHNRDYGFRDRTGCKCDDYIYFYNQPPIVNEFKPEYATCG